MSNTKTLAIIGCGNLGSSIARGLVEAGWAADRIAATRRQVTKLTSLAETGCTVGSDNVDAVRRSDTVLVAVEPQQLDGVLEDIREALDPKRHCIISVVSGASIDQIQSRVGRGVAVVRAMPNTAIELRESMTCIASRGDSDDALNMTKEIFEATGRTLVIEEELMIPATALCACGIAFFLRAIRAASQGGIEIGFHSSDAIAMAAQTAKGAASLLLSMMNHPEGEIDRVTTPRGCTIAGLNEMEHKGFSSAMIKGILTSAAKASSLYVESE